MNTRIASQSVAKVAALVSMAKSTHKTAVRPARWRAERLRLIWSADAVATKVRKPPLAKDQGLPPSPW
jgi:hypothetical protein